MSKRYLNLAVLSLSLVYHSSLLASDAGLTNKALIEQFRHQYIQPASQYNAAFINDTKKVKAELIKMRNVDQKVREELMSSITASCASYDCAEDYNAAANLAMELDASHLAALKTFMQKYHWFKISEFGSDGAEAAWLIVQHSNDIALKAQVLFIMQNLLSSHEANPVHYAMLYDRLSLEYKDLGIKQRFGSQFFVSADRKKLILEPCDGTLEEVEARRKKYGMEPLRENAKRLAKSEHTLELILQTEHY